MSENNLSSIQPEQANQLDRAGQPDSLRNASANADWGVILLGHGSQRGTSPRECSCAWQLPPSSSVSTPTPTPANGGDTSTIDDNLPGWPGWCLRCPSTPQGLGEAARLLQSELDREGAQVLLSCLEFIQPHPDEAIRLLSERGLNKVVIMPYLLGHGKHATVEMDEMLDEVRAQLPQVQLYVADGLGSDPRLASLVVERIGDLEATAPVPGPGQTVGILLVKAGTRTQYDDCQWLVELGRMVENRLGLGYAVDVAQSHYGDPTMEFAAARLVEERGVSAIICVPYIFFPGLILTRNVLGTMAQLQDKYPRVVMTVAPPLGVDDRLVAVAADRVREIWNQV